MSADKAGEFDPSNWECVKRGPTWQVDEEGKFILPERSLGWLCLRWCFEYLQTPEGKPWTFTPEQARFILWFYAIDEHGVFQTTYGTLRRLKGWGKDPIAACLAAFELCGPCRFDYWDADGNPVGKSPGEPWVVIAAVSKSQTQTTARLFNTLFSKKAIARYDLKVAKEVVYCATNGGKIETVTSSPGPLESYRPSFQIANEVQHWLENNDGHAMIDVMTRNSSKTNSRILALTNAFQPGFDSVAERDWFALLDVASGKAVDTGSVMYDSLEAPANAPMTPEIIPIVLERVRGDSIWLNIPRLTSDILNNRTAVSSSRRFFYNQIVSTDDALLTWEEWKGCEDEALTLADGDEIVLGLDGSKTDDSTALIAIRIEDRAVFPLGIWEKPVGPLGDDWQMDFDLVDDIVASAFRRYRVRAFFSDVHPIESYVDKWSNDYRASLLVKATPGKSTVGFDMRGNKRDITLANMALVSAIRDGGVKHAGHEVLRQHVMNCYEAENFHGISFRKESRESPRKVDAYAAMLLAFIALNKYLESGKRPKKERTGKAWFLPR